MTPFTDEDLKSLKESMEAQVKQHPGPAPMLDLIARLEAAEEVLNNLRGHEAETVDEDLMKRWRKTCGK